MRYKIPITAKPISSCQESLGWIQDYTIQYFKSHSIDSEAMWFIDDNQQCFSNGLTPDACVDIIMTGSFFLRLLELPYWPVKKFRLWTFSQDAREIISTILKINKERIGFIPHPQRNYTSETNQNFSHFAYAGRLSWGKNIEALLALTSYLQNTSQPHLQLSLWGENNDLPEESLGRFSHSPFDINDLIKEFSWITPPQVRGFQENWVAQLEKDSHYISLSTSMYEDFAVSPTEAMNRVPAILSGWGGHKHKDRALLVPSHLIFLSHEPQWIKKTKTKLLAKFITEKKFLLGSNGLHYFSDIFSIDELSPRVSTFISSQAPEILLCFREAVDVYADTSKGRNFFFKYRQAFSLPYKFRTIHFYNESRGESTFDEETILMNEVDFFLPEVQRLILTTPEIKISTDANQLISHLKRTLGLKPEITLI